MALFNDKWVRVFDISETSKHVKGFTLYKIVSIVYPKTCPDAVTKVTVWKRYNDFKKLHRELKVRHKSLHMEDRFPNLPKSSYFKRFDVEVISQRKNNILFFLEYVAHQPSLFKSIEFVKFFETSHTPQESLNSNINIIRAQLNLPNDPEILYLNSDDDQAQSDSDSVSTFSLASTSMLQLDESSVLDKRSISSYSNVNQKVSSPDSISNKSYKNFYPTPPDTPETVVNEHQSIEYLTNAAEYIIKATEFETEKKYQESFEAYKNGIANLLEGVKGDKDVNRRQMVRHKIEKYLLRAEKIYNLHLSPEINQIKNICKNGSDITTYSIKRPIEDLFNYKVLKLMDNGMIVLHRKEHNVFYLKVVQKSLQMSESVYLNIPKDVPYMVKLFQYYDSINAIFIVTQYVSGGKLFDQIKQRCSSSNNSLTKCSSVTFEKELCDLADKDLDDNSSETSECSYSDLITDYAAKKNTQVLVATFKNDKIVVQENSDTEESLITSHTSEQEKKVNNDVSSLNILSNKPEMEAEDTINMKKKFERTISEKSYTEEFSNVSYIPSIEDIIRWSAQLLLAIDKLHKVGVVISDLDPRNLLLDERRNLLLTHTCHFREKGRIYYSKFENNYYCAPEVFSLQNITFAADWWSYGAILFELLTGMSLKSVHPEGIYNYTILKIPKYVSAEGKSLLRQLLVYEPMERLGCGVNGTEDIRSHPFFISIDWIRLQVDAFKI